MTRGLLRRRTPPHEHQLAIDYCLFDHNAFGLVEPQVLEEHITHGRIHDRGRGDPSWLQHGK
jgi:hypothetical protein